MNGYAGTATQAEEAAPSHPPLHGSLADLHKRLYNTVEHLESILTRLRGATPQLANGANGKDVVEPCVIQFLDGSHGTMNRVENLITQIEQTIG